MQIEANDHHMVRTMQKEQRVHSKHAELTFSAQDQIIKLKRKNNKKGKHPQSKLELVTLFSVFGVNPT